MKALQWWTKPKASSCLRMKTWGRKATGVSLRCGSKEEKMKMPVKELLKPVLYSINSPRQQDAEEDRSSIPSCTREPTCGRTRAPPTAGSGCTWAWWFPRKAARSDVPTRARRGKKARCSSLMTLLSTRYGRTLRLSGWYSSWTCGTQSWPPSRDRAFLRFSVLYRPGTHWREAAFPLPSPWV